MKKRVLALLLAGVLVLANAAVVFAEDADESTLAAAAQEAEDAAHDKEEPTTETVGGTEEAAGTDAALEGTLTEEDTAAPAADAAMKYVDAATAISAAKGKQVTIVDVRLAEKFNEGHLYGSYSCPAFPLDDASLDAALKSFATATLSGTSNDIYIVCNSGKSGAQRATNAFVEAGISADRIYTVEGGAAAIQSADPTAMYKEISLTDALAGAQAGRGRIFDVRTRENYNKGHLTGSIWYSVANEANFKTFAQGFALDDKEIYIVCNSGNALARSAQTYLRAIGINPSRIYTITGGAKAEGFAEASTTDKQMEEIAPWHYVATKQAVENPNGAYILDIRTLENFQKGHLANALFCPIFPLEDTSLEAALSAFAAKNFANNGKDIYLVCNSGNRGAKKATAVLADAGIDVNRIYTVAGGAAALSKDYPSLMVTGDPDNDKIFAGGGNNGGTGSGSGNTAANSGSNTPAKTAGKNPKTGDEAQTSVMLVLMLMAAGTAVVAVKKRNKMM